MHGNTQILKCAVVCGCVRLCALCVRLCTVVCVMCAVVCIMCAVVCVMCALCVRLCAVVCVCVRYVCSCVQLFAVVCGCVQLCAEMIWPGMTVAKLCCTVSGWSFQEYLAKMRQDREWADLAFVHALGRAHGVNVVIFQAHMDETLVGEDLQDSVEHEDRIAVPVALVNDHHFWGVLPCGHEVAVDAVDKGEHATLRSEYIAQNVMADATTIYVKA